MADAPPRLMSLSTVRKGLSICEQRCAHFIELHQSGRWQRYYSYSEFVAKMREAIELARAWQGYLASAETEPKPKPEAKPASAPAVDPDILGDAEAPPRVNSH